jgi:hypothetical protein
MIMHACTGALNTCYNARQLQAVVLPLCARVQARLVAMPSTLQYKHVEKLRRYMFTDMRRSAARFLFIELRGITASLGLLRLACGPGMLDSSLPRVRFLCPRVLLRD